MIIRKQKLQSLQNDLSDSFVTCYLKGQIKNFRADINFPVVILCPGGGYTQISDRESELVALNFITKGYHVFVLNYSLLPSKKLYPKPLIELAKVFELVEHWKSKYHIDTKRIILVGFSAGGHVASLYTGMPEKWIRQYTTAAVIKPYRQILGYPLIDYTYTTNFSKKEIDQILGGFFDGAAQKLVTQNTPPTFIWTTQTDELVPIENSLVYISALVKHKVDYEAHIFGWGPHGLSMSDDQTNYLATDQKHADRKFLNHHVASWFSLAIDWLKQEKFTISN